MSMVMLFVAVEASVHQVCRRFELSTLPRPRLHSVFVVYLPPTLLPLPPDSAIGRSPKPAAGLASGLAATVALPLVW